MSISVYEYLSDFDNAELNEEDWREQMLEALENYNEEYGKEYNPNFLRQYQNWKRTKNQPEQ